MTFIAQLAELDGYAPNGHSGTWNVKLVSRQDCPDFEMIYGVIAPGGEADRHTHDRSFQAVYVLQGRGQVELQGAEPVHCGPGAVVRIPPGVEHYARNDGEDPLHLIIVYSPPL